jgi:3-deoxy-7-phosphoheptulonate synthase
LRLQDNLEKDKHMLVLMKGEATPEDVRRVKEKIDALGYTAHEIPGLLRIAIGITGNAGKVDPDLFASMRGVAEAVPVTRPYKLVGRQAKGENSEIRVGEEVVGGKGLAIIAGPCSVESEGQLLRIAHAVKKSGATFLRGGAFKPRSSPYAFQGMKEDGLVLLREARAETGLKIVTEVKDVLTLEAVAEVADVIQIGARNMNNSSLLEAVGDLRTPVLLKRGMSATIEELLMAAEYIASRGNLNIILCERGIRTFEPLTRNTLDLNAIPVVKELSHLPILVDPSHGIGIWEHIPAMALAGIAAGADGLMVEVHDHPAEALSDGAQSLKPERFAEMMIRVRALAGVLGRTVEGT